MGFRILSRGLGFCVCSVVLNSTSAYALLKFNEGRDQLFAVGNMSIGFDSNIASSNGGPSDVVTTTTLGLEYARRAGMIGVNGNVNWTIGSFLSNPSEDFANPSMNMEFVKSSGRTTGSLTLSAARQNQADAIVNRRIESWNYNTGLNWKYPVIERYSLSGSLGYGILDYTDNSTGLVDLTTASASLDLFYAYNSQRDLTAGYRIRQSDTSNNNQSIDHAFTVGVSGKIISKLNGNVRVGYQVRNESLTGSTFTSVTSSASVTWAVNKRFSLTGTLSKDFNTSGTESTSDNVTFNINAQYVLTPHWTLFSGVGAGYTDFLSGTDTGRFDEFVTWSAGVHYSMNEHFKASLTYSYLQSWSNRSASSFDRHSITLNLSTRW